MLALKSWLGQPLLRQTWDSAPLRGRRLLGGKFDPLGQQVTSRMAAYAERGYASLCARPSAERTLS